MGKILVIRGGAIGDFVLTLPVLAALKLHLPHNEIEVLGYPRIADLAVVSGLAKRVESIESKGVAGFFASRGQLDDYYAEYFGSFDLILSFLFDPDGIFEANVGRCSKAEFIAGPHRPNDTDSIHATACFLKPLERLAIFDSDRNPQLEFSGTGTASIATLGTAMHSGNWLAVHPRCGSEPRNWPETDWRAFLNHITDETDANILLIGGPAEEDRLSRLSTDLPQDRVAVAANVALPDLAQLLKLAKGFVGQDSGISHLAAAVGCEGILLWGTAPERVWRPPHPAFELIHSPAGLETIRPIQLFEATLRRWLS